MQTKVREKRLCRVRRGNEEEYEFALFATLWFTPKQWAPEMFLVSLDRKSDEGEDMSL